MTGLGVRSLKADNVYWLGIDLHLTSWVYDRSLCVTGWEEEEEEVEEEEEDSLHVAG